MLYWPGEDLDVLMLLRLSVLTGEHVNYSQIITKRSLLFSQLVTTLLTDYNQKVLTFQSVSDYFALLNALNTNAFNFHQYFEDKLFSHHHFICTTQLLTQKNSNFNTPLFNHSKNKNVICSKYFPCGTAYHVRFKNYTSKFTFK